MFILFKKSNLRYLTLYLNTQLKLVLIISMTSVISFFYLKTLVMQILTVLTRYFCAFFYFLLINYLCFVFNKKKTSTFLDMKKLNHIFLTSLCANG